MATGFGEGIPHEHSERCHFTRACRQDKVSGCLKHIPSLLFAGLFSLREGASVWSKLRSPGIPRGGRLGIYLTFFMRMLLAAAFNIKIRKSQSLNVSTKGRLGGWPLRWWSPRLVVQWQNKLPHWKSRGGFDSLPTLTSISGPHSSTRALPVTCCFGADKKTRTICNLYESDVSCPFTLDLSFYLLTLIVRDILL